jgi:hypothetical protein
MSEQIDIEIGDDGIKFDAKGFKGGTCLSELDEFLKYMKSVGIEVSIDDQKMKSEAYNVEREKNTATAVRK